MAHRFADRPTEPKVHRFYSTGEAYDASQRDGDIRDGDVLVATNERVVGVLVGAWPVAVTYGVGGRGEFHELEDYVTWDTFEGGRYARAAEIARKVFQ